MDLPLERSARFLRQSSNGLTQVVTYSGTLGSSGPSLVPDRLSSNVRLADSLVEWSVRLSFALPGMVHSGLLPRTQADLERLTQLSLTQLADALVEWLVPGARVSCSLFAMRGSAVGQGCSLLARAEFRCVLCSRVSGVTRDLGGKLARAR